MSTATLAKMVRDPRSGEIHLPNEKVAILTVFQNLDRTLLKVRWQAGGCCLVFPDDLDEEQCLREIETFRPWNCGSLKQAPPRSKVPGSQRWTPPTAPKLPAPPPSCTREETTRGQS